MIHYEFKTCISDGMELYGFVQEEPDGQRVMSTRNAKFPESLLSFLDFDMEEANSSAGTRSRDTTPGPGGISNPERAAQNRDEKRFSWIKAGRITRDEFYDWSERAREKREECDAGAISLEEFEGWLKKS